MDEFDINKYTIIRKVGEIYISDKVLGAGAFASVKLGYYMTKDNLCAVKEISKASLDEYKRTILFREIENMSQMNQKNLVNLITFCQTSSNFYICMGLCKNGSLENYMKAQKRTPELILAIARDILEGFRFLYSKNIIHRDIKPANLLVDEGTIKIADFGFSKSIVDMNQAELGTAVGTPLYASFEILTQESYSSKCDVFSVGVLLFEIAYEHHPFFPTNQPTSLRQLLERYNENPEIKFPKTPALSENFKEMLRGMIKVREKERLSWQKVFEMFDKENEHAKQVKLKAHNQRLESASFYEYTAAVITEIVNKCPAGTKFALHRIRFTAIYLGSLAMRNVKKAFADSSEYGAFPEFEGLIQRTLDRLDFFYKEEYKNDYLFELNTHLKLDTKDPSKNPNQLMLDILFSKIIEVLEIWKKEAMELQEIKQMLLCLHMLKKHPAPEDAKQFVEANKDKSSKEISSIIFK